MPLPDIPCHELSPILRQVFRLQQLCVQLCSQNNKSVAHILTTQPSHLYTYRLQHEMEECLRKMDGLGSSIREAQIKYKEERDRRKACEGKLGSVMDELDRLSRDHGDAVVQCQTALRCAYQRGTYPPWPSISMYVLTGA